MGNQIDDINFTKGFNDGYIISSYDQMLTEELKSRFDKVTDEYWSGFSRGLIEPNKEKTILESFKKLRNYDQEKDLEK
ncbi:MAG: hypothetical protein JWN78_2027 [Bacteroidota bacterium]|nr:hypothetical protein [Bacteroidota bacterium]